MKTTRRTFLISSAGLISTLAISPPALAEAEHLDENSDQAKHLGYRQDASRIDAKAQPKFKPGEQCANCQLFQGKPGDAWGPCPLFNGKAVSQKGWCTAYTPKG